MSKLIRAADLFCGAGGTSTGLLLAARSMGLDADLLAINHWDVAIATHSRNHERVRHLCQNLDKVDPAELVPGGRLDILVASPECKHHSNARGGKPRSDQRRADAWLLSRWIEKLYVDNLLIENVREFVDWGPLGANGLPLKRKKGEYFRLFIQMLQVNYRVEWKIINCADYGDATTRERFFLIARRPAHKAINWPEPSHASPIILAQQEKQPGLFKTKKLKPWVPAREIIDWNLQGTSIFARKRPLSPNTIARIIAGLKKYSGISFTIAEGGPTGQMEPRSVDMPLKTVMPNNRLKVVEPVLLNLKGKKRRARSVNSPAFSQCAGGNHQAVVEPFILNIRGGKDGYLRSSGVNEPLPTVTQIPPHALVETKLEPFIASVNHGGGNGHKRVNSVRKPMPTVTAFDAWSVIEPFLIQYFGERPGQTPRTRSVDDPAFTVTGQGRMGLVEPHLVPIPPDAEIVEGNPFGLKSYKGSDSMPLDKPLPTITAQVEHLGLVQPYLVKFYGTSDCQPVTQPLDTVTSKDRFGLVIPQLGAILDIRFRMLQPHELAAAMSFPKTYEFAGTREDKVAQIGNAVPVKTARALVKAILADKRPAKRTKTVRAKAA